MFLVLRFLDTFAGPFMSKLTFFIQYLNVSIANVGLIILGGQSLKVISNDSPAGKHTYASWL
jgi:hypothetical protein